MSMNTPPERPSLPQPPGSLRQLEILVGEWDMAGIHPAFPSAVHGHSSFAWLMEGSLLVWHFEWEPPGPPSAISVIGHDDEAVDTCTMLYADERGVARIYWLRLAMVYGRCGESRRGSPNASRAHSAQTATPLPVMESCRAMARGGNRIWM